MSVYIKIKGSALIHLRQKRGFTQEKLANLIGVDMRTIRNWEKNRTAVQDKEAFRLLCEALDCEPEDLLEDVSIKMKTALDLSYQRLADQIIEEGRELAPSEIVNLSRHFNIETQVDQNEEEDEERPVTDDIKEFVNLSVTKPRSEVSSKLQGDRNFENEGKIRRS